MARRAAVDVVVPTWEARELIVSCLRHLDRDTREHRVIVVDNGSTDGTVEAVRALGAHAVALPENRGFAAAVNEGIRAGTAEVVVLLNNDVEVRPGFIDAIARPLEEDPEIGMVSALLLRPDGMIDSVGLEIDPTLAPFPIGWGASEVPSPETLLGPTGAAAAYRREAIEGVGLFDERIFAYSEDTDLALRLRGAGWRPALAADAVGVHLGSASFGRQSTRQVRLRGWSRGYLVRKYGVLRSPRRAVRTVANELATVGWQILRTRQTGGAIERVKGWRAAAHLAGSSSIPAGAVNERITARDAIRRRRAIRGG